VPASLDLTVKINDAGFVVSARGERMPRAGPATDALGTAMIPKANASSDDARLAACASEITGSAAATSESSATLVAEPDSDIQTVIRVLDALRGENGALFPRVAPGLVRR